MIKMEKLRILVIFNSLMGVIGGGSRHIVEVVNYWIPTYEVTFLISNAGHEVAKEYIKPRQNKHVIVYNTPFDYKKNIIVYVSRLLKSILLSLKLRQQKYNVVIAPNFLPQNIVPTLFFKIRAKIVVYFHGGPPSLRKEEMRKRGTIQRIISVLNWEFCIFFARFFDLIFVVENTTKKYFIERGFDPKRITVVGNGIPFEQISKIEVDKKEYDGIFLGRLVPRKMRDLINVWKEVVKIIPDARLCIIGDGPEREELEAQANKYGLNIVLKGWVSDEDKYRLIKRSKVFVYPSYYESWGIVVAEALACGLPVVAYSQLAYKEVFGSSIIEVNVGDVKEMARKISDILKDYINYGDTAVERIEAVSRYDWREVANYQLINMQNMIEKL